MSGPTSVPAPAVAQAARTAVRAEGGRRGARRKNIAVHGLLILACVIAAFPILRVLSVALRPSNTLLQSEFELIPEGATLDSFITVLTETDLPLWLMNSLLITVGTSIIGVGMAATSAYAFSRYKFPFRGLGLTVLLATQLIPAAMLLVPLYLLAVQFKLANSYIGMVIGLSVTAVPFSIWILKG